MRRRRAPILSAFAALACWLSLAGLAAAHTGGPLNDDGCHADRRRGNFHCHHGPARGYEFRSRTAMKEAVESGNLAERPADTESFLRKLWPFGKHEATRREPLSTVDPIEAEADAGAPTPVVAPSPKGAAAATTPAASPAARSMAPAAAPSTPKAVPPAKAAVPATLPAIAAPLPSTPPAGVPAPLSPAPPAEPTPVERNVRSYEERLGTLEGLRDRGVITREEYEARRKAILDEL